MPKRSGTIRAIVPRSTTLAGRDPTATAIWAYERVRASASNHRPLAAVDGAADPIARVRFLLRLLTVRRWCGVGAVSIFLRDAQDP